MGPVRFLADASSFDALSFSVDALLQHRKRLAAVAVDPSRPRCSVFVVGACAAVGRAAASAHSATPTTAATLLTCVLLVPAHLEHRHATARPEQRRGGIALGTSASQGIGADMNEHVRPAFEMDPEQFRELAHRVTDEAVAFLSSLRDRPVTPGEPQRAVQAALGDQPLPDAGANPQVLLDRVMELLVAHSLFNGHPRFWGYITSSPAPLGALADFFASVINQNVGWWGLSPMANEIEAQTVRWIAELVGFPTSCGGLLVTGGNMANFVGFLAARKAKTPWDVRSGGLQSDARSLRVYCSAETHTWIQKAADMFGLGTDSIRWIDTDRQLRMDVGALEQRIRADEAAGDLPFMVVGTAGSVATGAVDPLPEIAEICSAHDLWFHVDGAYGGFGVVSPEAPPALLALSGADSVAVDPHKWLYVPIEAGCALVRDPAVLHGTFSFKPAYFHFDEETAQAPNYYEYGPQSTRGFRALKVWLQLQAAGRQGYEQMISDNIRLARRLFDAAEAHEELEALTTNLSITTFRYVPAGVSDDGYLNVLNAELVGRVQTSGEAYVSNAIIDGKFALRACLVNFRTTADDVDTLPDLAIRLGRDLHAARSAAAADRPRRTAVPGVPDAMASAPVFASAPDEAITALAARSQRRTFPSGTVLMRQGEPSDVMHVLLSGKVRVTKEHPELAEPLFLAEVGPGDTVGEIGVLDGEARSATVTAVEDTDTLELPAAVIGQAMLDHPGLAVALMRTFSRRLRNDADMVQHLLTGA